MSHIPPTDSPWACKRTFGTGVPDAPKNDLFMSRTYLKISPCQKMKIKHTCTKLTEIPVVKIRDDC